MNKRDQIAALMGPLMPPHADAPQGRTIPVKGARQNSRGLLDYYLGPTGIPQRLEAVNQLFNPVEGIGQSMQASQRAFAPDTSPWGRFEAVGDMLSGVAGAAAPMVAASRVGAPAADAVVEAMTGVGTAGKRVAGDFVADESGALRLFHGSPHDFDRFSMDKIGTGEGAQAYGHGLYFAENEGIAKNYRDALSRGIDGTGVSVRIDGSPIGDPTTDQIRAARFGVDKTVEGLRSQIASAQRKLETASPIDELGIGVSDRDMVQMDIDALTRRLSDVEGLAGRIEMAPAGRMYEVNVDANPEDFLDWDAPLSEQPPKVREAINRTAPPKVFHSRLGNEYRAYLEGPGGIASSFSGATRDDALEKAMQGLTGENIIRSNVPTMISKELREAGIPGIRYLDAGSRGAGDGSRNYVVFDENLISIVRKYGIAGAAAMLGMSQADVAAAMEQQ